MVYLQLCKVLEGHIIIDLSSGKGLLHFLGDGNKRRSESTLLKSCIAGYTAWRDKDTGSWYITAVVDIFQKRAHNTHILDMLTMVCNRQLGFMCF